MTIAVGALYIVFRMFGGKKAGGTSQNVLIAALLAFIFLCCAALMWLAYH